MSETVDGDSLSILGREGGGDAASPPSTEKSQHPHLACVVLPISTRGCNVLGIGSSVFYECSDLRVRCPELANRGALTFEVFPDHRLEVPFSKLRFFTEVACELRARLPCKHEYRCARYPCTAYQRCRDILRPLSCRRVRRVDWRGPTPTLKATSILC